MNSMGTNASNMTEGAKMVTAAVTKPSEAAML